jgi:hypothetical protein
METDRYGMLRDMFLAGPIEMRLGHTNGTVFPYEDYELPVVLREPIVSNDCGPVLGYKSCGRSSIVPADGKWFKGKGVYPRPFKKWWTGEPFGGMSKDRALNELGSSKKIHEKFKEYGYHGPIIPVALVEYDIPFNESEKIFAEVLESFGDSRLSSVSSRLGHANGNMKLMKSMDGEYRGNLVRELVSWLGFCHRVIKESGEYPGETSYGLENYVLYSVGDGFGIGRVDLASASQSKLSYFEKYRMGDLGDISGQHAEYTTLLDIRARLGSDPKAFRKAMKEFRSGDAGPEFDHDACLSHKRDFEKPYYASFDGDEVPNPIDKKMIYTLFDKVRLAPQDEPSIRHCQFLQKYIEDMNNGLL